ncbi:conjugal transfer protein TraI [Chitinophaga barathri]|uniref:Conjugal transfer protein TraI n=1 Tax=Chitinophaga barathri TaxID=1647451 RepID=A0A3N4MI66_9BACT|nr:conjugal transfer protein TraI [Chitinophaga barathri]RPD39339.1 conjugal transfer protein TraI [Chitinophaga barathri]
MNGNVKILVMLFLVMAFTLPAVPAKAIWWVAVKAAIKKALRAADLAIQRQQNKVIWLQNAQKVLENTMSKLKLNEISDWTERQRTLYKDYFEELNKVKSLIMYYQRIREIVNQQLNLVQEYKRAWSIVKNDRHFTVDEILYMGQVYEGILNETVRNVDQLGIIINSFKTQMSDAKRLEYINEISEKVKGNYRDLKLFNSQNAQLSLSRAKTEGDLLLVKRMYGLE